MSLEAECREQGFSWIAGVDEAGRGPLAGPVVAAACLIPPGIRLTGIRDSKLLSAKARKRLYWHILSLTISGVSVMSEAVIDEVNILQASRLAMREAVLALSRTPDFIFVDGRFPVDLPVPQKAVVKADRDLTCVGAASILAKVTRDAIMDRYHLTYPEYHFNQHKGYPTPLHRALLDKSGPSPIHRRSFRPVQMACGRQTSVVLHE